MSARLKEDEMTASLGEWLEQTLEPLKTIPRYLVPSYFDVIVVNVYTALLDQCYASFSRFESIYY